MRKPGGVVRTQGVGEALAVRGRAQRRQSLVYIRIDRGFVKLKNSFLDIIERYKLAKFHVSSNYSCLSLLQNVFLRKSHFCEKGLFFT